MHQEHPEAIVAFFASTDFGIYMISQEMALLHCKASIVSGDIGLISVWGNFKEFL